ncbi:unnamed protein product [Calicophoron daubneyi]|uniref:Uncharacterized protein n=1 Tax=Calicophoron daubneyi TaxID=300641 RepID=A0AAV2TD09_CALDB
MPPAYRLRVYLNSAISTGGNPPSMLAEMIDETTLGGAVTTHQTNQVSVISFHLTHLLVASGIHTEEEFSASEKRRVDTRCWHPVIRPPPGYRTSNSADKEKSFYPFASELGYRCYERMQSRLLSKEARNEALVTVTREQIGGKVFIRGLSQGCAESNSLKDSLNGGSVGRSSSSTDNKREKTSCEWISDETEFNTWLKCDLLADD